VPQLGESFTHRLSLSCLLQLHVSNHHHYVNEFKPNQFIGRVFILVLILFCFLIGLDKEFLYRTYRDVLVKNIDPLAKLNEFIEIYVRLARK